MPDERLNSDTLQGGAAPAARWNPALLALSLAAAGALYGLPFLKSAPNRLVSGEPLYFAALLHGPAWALAALLAMLLCLAFMPARRAALWAAVAASSLLVPGFIWLAASRAWLIAQTQSPIARSSLGSGFWLGLLLAGLMAADALQRLHAGRALRMLVLAADRKSVV